MTKCHKLVLTVAPESENMLYAFVERCLQDGVTFIAVAGENSSRIEDIIDKLVVGDGSDDSRFILTTSHPGEDLDSVVAFARSLTSEYAGDVEIVKL